MSSYSDFRHALDKVLRQRNPQTLCDFLVERGQWPEGSEPDPVYMWLMIAGAPELADLHKEADTWLRAHGHAEQAEEIAARRQSRSSNKPRPPRIP